MILLTKTWAMIKEGLVAEMVPVAFGYLSLPNNGGEETEATDQGAEYIAMAKKALGEGYSLGGVFVDVRGKSEMGLSSLTAALKRHEATAVVVPNVSHLQHVGYLKHADITTVARHLHTRLITVDGEVATERGR